jgi:hypothetical protein
MWTGQVLARLRMFLMVTSLVLGWRYVLSKLTTGWLCGAVKPAQVEFVAQRGSEDGVGLGVGVKVVFDAAFDFFGAGEDGAADLEGVAMAEAGRRLLLDAGDSHAAADFRVGERAVDERLDERVVVEAEKEMRAARELD